MEPTGNGIGGDLFAIVWDAKAGKLYGLNASGRSPYELTREHFAEQGLKEIPKYGPLPVSVPGCVDGWFELHGRFGKLPMKDLLAPAVRYAREGFPVSELIAHYWASGRRLAEYPGFAETYLPGGHAPKKGDIFRNPMLADSLEKIGAGGRDVFYKGELADVIDGFARRVGCFLRKRDLAEHASTWVEPVSVNYRGYDVWELPPNGQGIAALQMLNILEGYDLKSLGHNSAEYLHLMIEAKKVAFEDRARWYADPAFSHIPVATLLSKDYAAERRKLIDAKQAGAAYPHGKIDLESDKARRDRAATGSDSDGVCLADALQTSDLQLQTSPRALRAADQRLREGDTIYLTVADSAGNMVSLIQSNFRGFGSGLCPDGLGFCLQDRGELFSLEEGHPNVYEPHKRPFHTIIPGFVTKDGKPFISFGVMGGDMQPQGHVQVLCNIIDFGMNLQEAGDAARWYHSGSSEPTGEVLAGGRQVMRDGGVVALESGIPEPVRRALEALGHKLGEARGAFGGYQAIRRDAEQGVYYGASESRKDGHAAGY
jgi:gamma-glutamyltranspeptidase/glutathione hydrolase